MDIVIQNDMYTRNTIIILLSIMNRTKLIVKILYCLQLIDLIVMLTVLQYTLITTEY